MHNLVSRICVAIFALIFLTGCLLFSNPPGKGPKAEQRYAQSAPVIAALKRYHAKHGTYPASLSSLVPDEIARLPDIYTSDSVVDRGTYQRIGTSYELGFRYVEGGMNECRYQPEAGWQCSGYI